MQQTICVEVNQPAQRRSAGAPLCAAACVECARTRAERCLPSQVRSFNRLRESMAEVAGPRTLANVLWSTLTARTSWLLKPTEVTTP